MSEARIGSADDVVPESDAEAQVDRGKPVDGGGLGTAGEIEAHQDDQHQISEWHAEQQGRAGPFQLEYVASKQPEHEQNPERDLGADDGAHDPAPREVHAST